MQIMQGHPELARLRSLYGDAKTARNLIETTWQDCYDYVDPIRGSGLMGNAGASITDANTRKSVQYKGTAAKAVRQLVSHIVSGMVPANARWLDLDISNNPDYRDPFLDHAAEQIWRETHASNFDSAIFEAIADNVIAGQLCLFVDDRGGVPVFEVWPLAQVYVASSRPDGQVDIVWRVVSMTGLQLEREYGKDALPHHIQETIKSAPSTQYEVTHCIYPREVFPGGEPGRMAKSMPIGSLHYLDSYSHVLRESGYEEMPVICPRWRKAPNSPYGVGLVYDALPDIKTENLSQKYMLEQAEMAICGMWGAVDDGILNPAAIKIGPRRVITVNKPEDIFPLNPPGNLAFADVMIDKLSLSVMQALMADQLAIPESGDMTATEINTRMELLRQMLGPVFGRMQSELLQPLVFRVFGILVRADKLSVPDHMTDAVLNVRFISPLARAQRLNEVAAMDRFEVDLISTAQAKPDILDVYDWDEAKKEKSWLLGVPQRLILDSNKVKAIRKTRAEAQAQAQQQAVEDEQAIKQGAQG